MDDKEQIKELYRKYWQFMIAKDESGLRSLMSEDYVLRHMTGVTQSADEFIAGLMNGTFNYYSAEHEAIDVKVTGNEAKLTGKSIVVAAVYGGSKGKWRLKGDFKLRNENGSWKIKSSQASTY